MTSLTYKGFRILARPYQLHDTRRWTVDLEIRRNGRRKPFSLDEHYQTENEAEARCSGLARRIIDGRVPGWSVEHLRESQGQRVRRHSSRGTIMRPFIIVGAILAALGAFVLLRGMSFNSQSDVLKIGEVKITATEKQRVPQWVGGAALVIGVGLIVAGMRQKA